MRIVIDMQGAQNGSRYRGIGRYTLALAEGMLRAKSGHEIILALNGLFPEAVDWIRSFFSDKLPQENIVVWRAPYPVNYLGLDSQGRRQAAELLREAFLLSLNPDVVLISSMFEGAGDNVVTSIGTFGKHVATAAIVYDLIPLLNRDAYLADDQVGNWYMEKLAYLKKADILLSISEASRLEAIENAQIAPERIFNISTAVDPEFTQIESREDRQGQVLSSYGIVRPYVMYCSASDPRKNHLRLIDAFSRLPAKVRKGHQLVLAGGMPLNHQIQFRDHAGKAGLTDQDVIMTGYLDDKDMVALYKACKCFVFPSWHEGFGLPILEAMWCDAPVIGSSTSSVPEVIGNSAALFDPFNTDAIAERIAQVLMDNEFRERLIEHGRTQRTKFSWDATARSALRILEECAHVEGAVQMQNISSVRILDRLVNSISLLPACSFTDQELAWLASDIDNSIVTNKIFVDISELVQRDSKSGIQRVVRSIIHALLGSDVADYEIEYVYATATDPYRYANRFISRLVTSGEEDIVDDEVAVKAGDIFLVLDFQDVIASAQAPFFEKIRMAGAKVCFVVYDLLPVTLPDFFSLQVRENFEKWLRVVAAADGAICISEAVAMQLGSWLEEKNITPCSGYIIDWFHLGADMAASLPSTGVPADAETFLNQLNRCPSFLMVGTIEPRKGHIQVLDAFEQLWQSGTDINLVIVGKQGWMVEALVARIQEHQNRNKHLYWLEGISDEYLEKVYAASTCLIAASYGEGFGLPLIEAAQHKLPIIARDIPVFREVAGEHAFFFSAHSTNGLAEAIKSWIMLYEQGKHPGSENLPWITWQESARQLKEIILSCK